MMPFEGSGHPLRPLFAVADIQLGRMLQPDASGYSDRSVAYLRASNVQDGRVEWSDVKHMYCPPNEVQSMSLGKGDLLVCEGGDVGRVAMLDVTPSEPTVFQNALHRIICRTGVEPRFIFYALQALYTESDYYSILCNGATIRHLTVEKLRKVRVPVPSFEEQRRIADFLDDQVALLDRAIELRQRQRALLGEAADAEIDHMVRGCSDPDLREADFKPLGQVPTHSDIGVGARSRKRLDIVGHRRHKFSLESSDERGRRWLRRPAVSGRSPLMKIIQKLLSVLEKVVERPDAVLFLLAASALVESLTMLAGVILLLR